MKLPPKFCTNSSENLGDLDEFQVKQKELKLVLKVEKSDKNNKENAKEVILFNLLLLNVFFSGNFYGWDL